MTHSSTDTGMAELPASSHLPSHLGSKPRLRVMRRFCGLALASVTALSMGPIGCASVVGRQYEMTEALIDIEGTRFYDARFDDVFTAAQAALGSLGFEIATSNPATGHIETKQRAQHTEASGTSVARTYFTLTIDVELISAQRSKVRVYPRRYVGMEKTESQEYWQTSWLERHWQGLFRDMSARLKTREVRPDEASPRARTEKIPLVIGR